MYGNSAKNAPIYLEGSSVIINNDAGTGNVGIGTAAPQEKLEIKDGGIFINAKKQFGGIYPNNFDYKNAISFVGTGWHDGLQIFSQDPGSGQNTYCGDIYSCVIFNMVDRNVPPVNSNILFGSTIGSTGAFTPIMAIRGDTGNVGIGTTAPGYKLTVYGQGNFSRDNAAECCSSGDFTLSLAEATNSTGRRAGIQFHNAGEAEGQFKLNPGPHGRELLAYSYQTDMDLHATGIVRGDQGLCIGGDCRSSWQDTSPCPAGFNDTGYGFCIQNDKAYGGGGLPWADANDYCADNYGARLCTATEWHAACINNKAINMTGGPTGEWVSDWGDSTHAFHFGRDGCNCFQTWAGSANNVQFRCCRNK